MTSAIQFRNRPHQINLKKFNDALYLNEKNLKLKLAWLDAKKTMKDQGYVLGPEDEVEGYDGTYGLYTIQ